MITRKFKAISIKLFISKLVDNEGSIFGDQFGRKWVYIDFRFLFKDINSQWAEGLKCIHLFGIQTEIERKINSYTDLEINHL